MRSSSVTQRHGYIYEGGGGCRGKVAGREAGADRRIIQFDV